MSKYLQELDLDQIISLEVEGRIYLGEAVRNPYIVEQEWIHGRPIELINTVMSSNGHTVFLKKVQVKPTHLVWLAQQGYPGIQKQYYIDILIKLSKTFDEVKQLLDSE